MLKIGMVEDKIEERRENKEKGEERRAKRLEIAALKDEDERPNMKDKR